MHFVAILYHLPTSTGTAHTKCNVDYLRSSYVDPNSFQNKSLYYLQYLQDVYKLKIGEGRSVELLEPFLLRSWDGSEGPS